MASGFNNLRTTLRYSAYALLIYVWLFAFVAVREAISGNWPPPDTIWIATVVGAILTLAAGMAAGRYIPHEPGRPIPLATWRPFALLALIMAPSTLVDTFRTGDWRPAGLFVLWLLPILALVFRAARKHAEA